MEQDSLIYEKKGRLAYITINRPQVLNAVDLPTRDKLIAAFSDFKEDPDVWVAIISGAGDRAFCAGADLKYWATHEDERKRRFGGVRELYDPTKHASIFSLPNQVWKPIIAAVNGYCLGGGCQIALLCDIIIATPSAEFGQPEITHGWGAGLGLRWSRKAPLNIVMEMLMTGNHLTAEEAHRIGVVNRIVPFTELLPTATAVAEKICENPPMAVRAVKEITLRGLDLPFEYPLSAAQLTLEPPPKTSEEDMREARQAFREKRKPVFKGR